jgi:hypothetical protein
MARSEPCGRSFLVGCDAAERRECLFVFLDSVDDVEADALKRLEIFVVEVRVHLPAYEQQFGFMEQVHIVLCQQGDRGNLLFLCVRDSRRNAERVKAGANAEFISALSPEPDWAHLKLQIETAW